MTRISVVLVAVLLLGACGDDATTIDQGGEEPTLRDRTFLSTSVTGRDLVDGTTIRITFDADGRLGAHAGCNSLGAQVELAGGRIIAGDGMSMTEIGCDPAQHDQDEWLATFLTSEPTYELDDDRLVLTSGSTTIELVDREVADPDRPVVGTTWEVTTVIDGETASTPPGGGVATLRIDDRDGGGELVVDTGCNEVRGPVEVGATELQFGQLTTTDVACPGDAGELQQAVLAVLDGSATYEVTADSLTLEHVSGAGLVLRATG